jgi:hypothetical protein
MNGTWPVPLVEQARRQLRFVQEIEEAWNTDRVSFAAQIADDFDEPATF